jgi:hypothetical protein
VVQAHQARTAPIRKKPGRRSALPNQAAQQTADHLECPAAEANGTSIILMIPATEADPLTEADQWDHQEGPKSIVVPAPAVWSRRTRALYTFPWIDVRHRVVSCNRTTDRRRTAPPRGAIRV